MANEVKHHFSLRPGKLAKQEQLKHVRLLRQQQRRNLKAQCRRASSSATNLLQHESVSCAKLRCYFLLAALAITGQLASLVNGQLPPLQMPQPPHFQAPLPAINNPPMGGYPPLVARPEPLPESFLVSPSANGMLVMPYEGFKPNSSQDLDASYIIENKRFVEAASSRCYSSTIMESPKMMEPSFVIITKTSEIRLNATAPVELVRAANFDPQKRTTILVHGFTQSYPNSVWLRKTRALFELNSHVGRQNLIIMDWGLAAHSSYAQAAALVSGMGSFLANFLMKLLKLGADRMGIHIVSHSLGAHLAGFAGKRIRPRIGRITALDPAGPCFGKLYSNSPLDRLSPDDAYQVAVFHYDDDFLGLSGQHGQFDVYVNGGSSQPGCSGNMNTMMNAAVTMLFQRNRALSESHSRATEVSSCQLARTQCQQVAYECRDWDAFKHGECGKCDSANNQCFLMSLPFQYGDDAFAPGPLGPHLRTSFPGKRLYVSTSAVSPFCSHHYQVLVKFETHPELAQLARHHKWGIQMEMAIDTNERFNITLTNQMAPNIFSFLMLAETPRPFRVRAASLKVQAANGVLVSLHVGTGPKVPDGRLTTNDKFRVLSAEVNYMSNINPNVRRALSTRLCPLLVAPNGKPWSPKDDKNSIQDSPSSTWIQLNECFGPPAR